MKETYDEVIDGTNVHYTDNGHIVCWIIDETEKSGYGGYIIKKPNTTLSDYLTTLKDEAHAFLTTYERPIL